MEDIFAKLHCGLLLQAGITAAGSCKQGGLNCLPVTHNVAACCPLDGARTLNRLADDQNLVEANSRLQAAFPFLYCSCLSSSAILQDPV